MQGDRQRKLERGTMSVPTIYKSIPVNLGCDPELFIRKGKQVVGSEEVVPDGGLAITTPYRTASSTIEQDGLQVELHPSTTTCRGILSNSITALFKTLKLELDKKGLAADFSQVINLSTAEMKCLSDKAKQIGCMPSNSLYGLPSIEVDGSKFKQRSAAGHIHLGVNDIVVGKLDPTRVVRILDVILGTTCVLLDRGEAAAERRKTYGRAGEYRLPKHGLEYRVLSNFWLQGYPLFGLVMSLARTGVWIAAQEKNGGSSSQYDPKIADPILTVDPARVQRTINENDFDEAMKIFNEVTKPFFTKYCHEKEGLGFMPEPEVNLHEPYLKYSPNDPYYGPARRAADAWKPMINPACIGIKAIDAFEHLVEKGINHYWPNDPLTHWCNKGDGHNCGWENFTLRTLIPDMLGLENCINPNNNTLEAHVTHKRV